MSPIAGWVLAGGRSSRMGQDKSLLVLEGKTLVEHALEKLTQVCGAARIAGLNRPELSRYADGVPDEIPECGPLGGLVAALGASEQDWNLFLPVDTPFVPATWLQRLAAETEKTESLAVITRLEGRAEPLIAAYHRGLLGGLRTSLHAGRYKVLDAVEQATVVDWVEVVNLPSEAFINLNTPEDLAAMHRRLK